jgi:glycosyltransferase involved in cell wall biosynthesis
MFPLHCDDTAVSHAAVGVVGGMAGAGLETVLFVPSSSGDGRRPFVRDGLPSVAGKVLYRLGREPLLKAITESRFRRSVGEGDIAFVWPGVSGATLSKLRSAGGRFVVAERINCHTGTAKRILDDAYARLGLPPAHGITERQAREETDELRLADAVFAPSPLVAESLVEHGLPRSAILECTYGWNPARFEGTARALPPDDRDGALTVLFVGRVCVRKGAHLLLEAWAKSRLRGRLVFAGQVEPALAEACADHLSRPDVIRLGHLSDAGAAYRSADVFAFPTLEEGSPLVAYEALGCGLPAVVSPMGAGSVIRDGVEGLVIEPYAVDAWADALNRLARDRDLRRQLSEGARLRAAEFTWSKAGARRRELLLSAVARKEGAGV